MHWKVWGFFFSGEPYPVSSNIPSPEMKQGLEYWYPFDLRVFT